MFISLRSIDPMQISTMPNTDNNKSCDIVKSLVAHYNLSDPHVILAESDQVALEAPSRFDDPKL